MLTSSDNTIMNAIEVHNLSKRYWIQHERPMLAKELLLRPFRLGRRPQEFWALRDVSFSVKRRETVGIIGENGAGKSTLLKILTGVTQPTSGSASVCGRVGALLELGAGFHPDLTGRENTYLNGAILGMSRREIDRKFEAIAEFADIGEFMDSPVRRYSSGMFVRLGFSVAIHLDPEVLAIDEVLAVGDSVFQQKCLLKMRDLSQQGTTCIFVSHNMHHVGILAHRCIYVRSGTILYDGDTAAAIGRYLSDALQQAGPEPEPEASREASLPRMEATPECHIVSITAASADGSRSQLNPGEDLHITIRYRCKEPVRNVHFHTAICTAHGLLVTCADSRMANVCGWTIDGEGQIRCIFPSLPLITGRYLVRAYVLSGDTNWPLASFGSHDGRTCSFLIRPQVTAMTTEMVWYPTQSDYGIVRLPFKWEKEAPA